MTIIDESVLSAIGQFALQNGILRVRDRIDKPGKEIHIEWPNENPALAKHYVVVLGSEMLDHCQFGAQQLLAMEILRGMVKIDEAFGS